MHRAALHYRQIAEDVLKRLADPAPAIDHAQRSRSSTRMKRIVSEMLKVVGHSRRWANGNRVRWEAVHFGYNSLN
jgi:hypothetical protein